MGGDDLGEAGVFREKTVAWVHSLSPSDLTGRYDTGNVEITLGGGGGTDAHALVGQAHVHGGGVGLGVHGHGGDAHLLAGPVDAQGNLAAIGDEDLVEH